MDPIFFPAIFLYLSFSILHNIQHLLLPTVINIHVYLYTCEPTTEMTLAELKQHSTCTALTGNKYAYLRGQYGRIFSSLVLYREPENCYTEPEN